MIAAPIPLTQYVPRPWQMKCHRVNKRFKVLVLHRRAGKSWRSNTGPYQWR